MVLADQAKEVVHQGSDGENVWRVHSRSDDFQTDFVVLKSKGIKIWTNNVLYQLWIRTLYIKVVLLFEKFIII
jgi:hypothetical protein